MLPKSLFIAVRHISKHKGHTAINLVCLSIGFLSLILITLYLDHELHYDQFHPESARIFRLTDPWGTENSVTTPAFVPHPWAGAISSEFPEIEAYTRVQKRLRFSPLLSYKDVRFFEDGFISVDSTFFQLFNFKLKYGDPQTALKDPGSIVLTESKALKFFGTENPLDKIITLDNDKSLRVTGVLEDLPTQSHLDFNYIIPLLPTETAGPWVYSYFRVSAGTDIAALEAKVKPFLKERFADRYTSHQYQPTFQRLHDIHLKSKLTYEFRNNGNINNIYLISAVGFLILIIACFNYVNITTALASLRLREFGMRKTLGGLRSQLISQSVLESVVISLLSYLIALALSSLAYAPFGDLVGRKFEWADFSLKYVLPGFLFACFIGIFSGT